MPGAGFAQQEEMLNGVATMEGALADAIYNPDPVAAGRLGLIAEALRDHFAHASAEDWGSLTFDVASMFIGGEGFAKFTASIGARLGARIGGRVSRMLARVGRLTISANRATGNPRAIARGLGELNRWQRRALEMLPEAGSRAFLPKKAFGTSDLAALTAHTGDEFAMFTKQGQRMLVRGDYKSVPIGLTDAEALAQEGWRWSAHTHPGMSANVLRSSPGDRLVLSAFGNQRSAIVNSFGDRGLFNVSGDLLTDWRPF